MTTVRQHYSIFSTHNFVTLKTAIIFRFEHPFYTFDETDGVLRDTINVIKQPGNVSEQTLTLLVDHTPASAKFGMT